MPGATWFTDDEARINHFLDHGDDFGITDDGDYQAAARKFLNADRAVETDIQECTRSNGDIVRFNALTNKFAIMAVGTAIRTYYKPMPRHLAPLTYPPYKPVHDFLTNPLYFEDNCAK